jgi:DNA-binding cell septation regulator SpoVG
MEITDIRIRKVPTEGKLKAYVPVTFDECFVVHNVKIIEGKTASSSPCQAEGRILGNIRI